MKRILAGMCFGVALTITLLFVALFVWKFTSYEAYIWIIEGPWPFGSLGSGPFQLVTILTVALKVGILLSIGTWLLMLDRKE